METEKKQRYFNFPIELLEGFLENDRQVLDNIYDYATYVQAISYETKEGFEWVKEDIEKAVELSDSYFGVITGNKEKAFKKGNLLHDSIPLNVPMVGIGISIFFDYYKNNKNEFQKVCLLGFLAIKSILGNKSYCKTNNAILILRMNGYTKNYDCNKLSPYFNEITKTKYKTRYHIQDKLIQALEIDWGLKYWSDRIRGFYVSFKMELEELALISKQRKKKTKKEELRERKLKIKQKLKTTP